MPRDLERKRQYDKEWSRRNRTRRLASCRRWAAKHRDRKAYHTRSTTLKRKYGIDQRKYESMLDAQGGVCAICGVAPSVFKDSLGRRRGQLQVDHNHATGIVRGLLCGHCNVALGNLGDNAARLHATLQYLMRYEPNAISQAVTANAVQ